MSAILWSFLAQTGRFVPGHFFAGVAIFTVCYLLIERAQQPFSRAELVWLFGAALLARVAALTGPVVFEDDFARYLWDGYQTLSSGTPYGKAPAQFFGDDAQSQANKALLSLVNNPDYPTIYGAVPEYLFAAAYFVFGATSTGLRVLYLLVEFGLVIFFLQKNRPTSGILAAILLHPLLLEATYFSAHFEVVTVMLLFAAHSVQSRSAQLIGAGLTLATRLPLAILLPYFVISETSSLRSARQLLDAARRAAAIMVVALLISLPLYFVFFREATGKPSELGILLQFAQNFQFNSFIATVFEFFPDRRLAKVVGTSLFVFAYCFVFWLWRSKRINRNEAESLSLLSLFICSPIVNPWYALWLVPFLADNRFLSVRYFPLLVQLAYFNGTHVMPETLLLYQVHPVAWGVEYGMLVLLLICDTRKLLRGTPLSATG